MVGCGLTLAVRPQTPAAVADDHPRALEDGHAGRGVAADIEWLRSSLPAAELDALQKNNTNRGISIVWLPALAGRTTPAPDFRLKAEATKG